MHGGDQTAHAVLRQRDAQMIVLAIASKWG